MFSVFSLFLFVVYVTKSYGVEDLILQSKTKKFWKAFMSSNVDKFQITFSKNLLFI